MIKLISLIVVTATLYSNTAHAAHFHKEAEYRDAWCKGRTEVTLHDGSRVDCLTENYAVEFDFAPKAYEALGQAIHYARITGMDPAIVLIIENEKDWRHYNRIRRTAKKRGVKLWYMAPQDIGKQRGK